MKPRSMVHYAALAIKNPLEHWYHQRLLTKIRGETPALRRLGIATKLPCTDEVSTKLRLGKLYSGKVS